MKIIKIDNFDRDSVSDELIAENVSAYYIEFIVEELNQKYSGSTSPYFFMAVPDDRTLYKFEP